MNDAYLKHHGILGQKWGVRRFQNKDGSLTNAGKKKYLKEMNRDMEDHFNKQISEEARKVTRIGKNDYDERGSSWNDAYRKGKVTKKDDAQIKLAAKNTREYMLNKYGEQAVKALTKSGWLGTKVSDLDLGNHSKNNVDRILKKGTLLDVQKQSIEDIKNSKYTI